MNKGLIPTENVTGLSQRNAKEFGPIIVKKFTDIKFSSLNFRVCLAQVSKRNYSSFKF